MVFISLNSMHWLRRYSMLKFAKNTFSNGNYFLQTFLLEKMAPSSYVVIRVFQEALREVWMSLRFIRVLITILVIIQVVEVVFTGFWDCGKRPTLKVRFCNISCACQYNQWRIYTRACAHAG